MNWYILAIIPVLGVLVFVHELGHFLAAKWAGIRVEEFGMGFPPALVSIRRRERGGWEVLWFGQGREHDDANTQNPFTGVSGGSTSQGDARDASRSPYRSTRYSLNLLPIGGFVRMPGETGDAVDDYGKYDPDSFAAKSAGKRIIVLCAGVFMNLVLAFVLFTIAYGVGEPISAPVITTVEQNSPAAAAHLHPNDRIISVNNKSVQTFDDVVTNVTNAISADKSDKSTVSVTLVIRQNGSSAQKTVTVDARKHPAKGQGAMGIVGGQVTIVKTPFWQAPFKGIVLTYNMLHTFLSTIKGMIVGAIQPQFAGPVGIAQITGDVAQMTPTYGWWPILTLTAFLSLNLAIMNILPFPALDGGRVVLVLIELLRGGKRLKPEREGLINFIGIAILLLLMVVVTVNDITHLGG